MIEMTTYQNRSGRLVEFEVGRAAGSPPDVVRVEPGEFCSGPLAYVKLYARKGLTQVADAEVPVPSPSFRVLQVEDAPTIEEYVAANYRPENYPPEGWAEVPSAALDHFRSTGKMPGDEPAASEPAPTGSVDVDVPDGTGEMELTPVEPMIDPPPMTEPGPMTAPVVSKPPKKADKKKGRSKR